jgi:protein TonB
MAARQVGVVMLRVTVAPDGSAAEVVLALSSGYSLLDTAALDAVRGWRFAPGRKAGVAVASNVHVPVRFGFAR